MTTGNPEEFDKKIRRSIGDLRQVLKGLDTINVTIQLCNLPNCVKRADFLFKRGKAAEHSALRRALSGHQVEVRPDFSPVSKLPTFKRGMSGDKNQVTNDVGAKGIDGSAPNPAIAVLISAADHKQS